MERTLVLIKPDGVRRKLVGEIISIYEKKNLDVVGLKMVRAPREVAEEHYFEHKGRPYFESLINFIIGGDLCALVLQGPQAIELVRKVNGDKNPLQSDLGSIRGRFASETSENIVHASDSAESAEREIGIWFPELGK